MPLATGKGGQPRIRSRRALGPGRLGVGVSMAGAWVRIGEGRRAPPPPPPRRAGCAPPTHATSPRVPAAPCAVHCRRRRRRMRPDAQHLEDLPPRIAARAGDSQGERGLDRNGGHGRVPGRRGSEDAPRGIEPGWCGEEQDSLPREDSGELEAASNILISDVGFLASVL